MNNAMQQQHMDRPNHGFVPGPPGGPGPGMYMSPMGMGQPYGIAMVGPGGQMLPMHGQHGMMNMMPGQPMMMQGMLY